MVEQFERLHSRAGNFLDAEVGDELVAMDVAVGECFGFNPVARRVWELLAKPKSFAQLRDVLLAEYDVTDERCGAELQDLLDDFTAKGLIIFAAD